MRDKLVVTMIISLVTSLLFGAFVLGVLASLSGCATFDSSKLETVFDGKHHISCKSSCKGKPNDPDREICHCLVSR